MQDKDKEQLVAELHKGLPDAKVDFEQLQVLNIRLGDREGEADVPEDAARESMRISLDAVRVDLHNQSFGMLSASTGCISNPGGPSC